MSARITDTEGSRPALRRTARQGYRCSREPCLPHHRRERREWDRPRGGKFYRAARRLAARRHAAARGWSIRSAAATPRAEPTCAICSAARAPTWPRWRGSASRYRPDSRLRPMSAPVSTTCTSEAARRLGLEGAVDSRAARRSKRRWASRFGDPARPLLVSVRSGAGVDARNDGHGAQPRPQRRHRRRAAKPSPATPVSAGTATDASSRCSATSSRAEAGRQGRARPVRGRSSTRLKEARREFDVDLTATICSNSSTTSKRCPQRRLGIDFPEDPREQLWRAIGAVFGSWMNPRAVSYRRLNDIPAGWGTAQSTCRRWSSATSETTAAPASPSPATRRRREGALRRVPRQRAGRGRRRRHRHAAADHTRRLACPSAHQRRVRTRARPPRTVETKRCALARSAHRPNARAALQATCRTSSSRFEDGRSSSCCRPARQAHRRRASRLPSTWRRSA